tara:strand:+ start:2340 stop:3380 length:1041 start_codon:yes stop_codon:yes gene_type:complete
MPDEARQAKSAAAGGKQKNSIHGWVNINKPVGMGSTDVVRAVKRILRPEKVGHAGTLDPLADGVLPIALGEATKTVPYLMEARKTYHFTIRFGAETTTDDAEGEVVAENPTRPSIAEITAVLPQFTGEIEQVPPAYSAIKIDGQRAYDLARAGEAVAMKPRRITVYSLEVASRVSRDTSSEGAWSVDRACQESAKAAKRSDSAESRSASLQPQAEDIHFIACVSKGTYIRSLARDIARGAGACGHVVRLHRAAVGKFTISEAISLDLLEKVGHTGPQLLSMDWALDDIPAIPVEEAAARRLCHGQPIPLAIQAPLVRIYCEERLIALAEERSGEWWPKRVFNNAPS